MATLSVRTLWQALEMLGYEPGPATNHWNDTIKRAASAFARDRIEGGNPTVIDPVGVAPMQSVSVIPNSSADFLRHQAATYIEPSSAEFVRRARTEESSTRPVRRSEAALTPAPAPFFRMNNPAAWALFLIPIALGLGYAGWRFTRTTRRSRRG